MVCGYEKNQKLKKTRIIFWEKNGLRHGEFDLPNDIYGDKDFDVVGI